MAEHGHQNLAFHAAGFKGAAQPNGYTEPLLYRFRAGLEAQTSIRWLPRRIIPLYWKFIQGWAMPNHSPSNRARGRSIRTRRPIIGNETGRTSAPLRLSSNLEVGMSKRRSSAQEVGRVGHHVSRSRLHPPAVCAHLGSVDRGDEPLDGLHVSRTVGGMLNHTLNLTGLSSQEARTIADRFAKIDEIEDVNVEHQSVRV
jgi:hypothetical protein